MIQPKPQAEHKSSRAELLQADLAWFAMYLLHECIDCPLDDPHTLYLLEGATQELAHIRSSYRGSSSGHRGHPGPGARMPR